jgi:hypothetical protein
MLYAYTSMAYMGALRRLSARSSYIKVTDEMEDAMSPPRHRNLLNSPTIVTYGPNGRAALASDEAGLGEVFEPNHHR